MSQAAFTALTHAKAQRYFSLLQKELLQLTFPLPMMTVCTSKTPPTRSSTGLLSRNPVFIVALTALSYKRPLFTHHMAMGNVREFYGRMHISARKLNHRPILQPYSHATDWYKFREAQREVPVPCVQPHPCPTSRNRTSHAGGWGDLQTKRYKIVA